MLSDQIDEIISLYERVREQGHWGLPRFMMTESDLKILSIGEELNLWHRGDSNGFITYYVSDLDKRQSLLDAILRSLH